MYWNVYCRFFYVEKSYYSVLEISVPGKDLLDVLVFVRVRDMYRDIVWRSKCYSVNLLSYY